MSVSPLIISLIVTIITIPINGLLLMLTTKIFKLTDQSYKTAIKIAVIIGVVVFILTFGDTTTPLLFLITGVLSFILGSILLPIWLVKTHYKLDWGKTLLIWVVWFVFSRIAGLIISVIVGFTMVALNVPVFEIYGF